LLAHAEIAAAAPFAVANDLVARALERLVLVVRGVDPASVTVPEAGHLLMVDDYRAALAAYRTGSPDGMRHWLLYSCDAIGRGVASSPLSGRAPSSSPA
jgi:hypothetical protein